MSTNLKISMKFGSIERGKCNNLDDVGEVVVLTLVEYDQSVSAPKK